MSLAKLIQLPSAVEVSFWSVGACLYNRREKVIEIVALGYLDAAAYAAGAEPVTQKIVRVQGDEAEIAIHALHDAAGGLLYAAIKETPEFADAANV